MPRKITRTVKRISTKIKATLRKRRLLKKQVISKKSGAASRIPKPTPAKKSVKKTPAPLTPTSLKSPYPSKISLKSHRPYWFIAQWQLSPIEIEVWKRQSLKSELALRLYSSEEKQGKKRKCVQTILIPGSVRNWHLYTESLDDFYIELGFFNKKNQFICLCRSNLAKISLPSKTSKSINSNQTVLQLAFTPDQQKWIEQRISQPSAPYPIYGGS